MNTSYDRKMLSSDGVKFWSELDHDLKSLGWLSFKKYFKRKLLDKYGDLSLRFIFSLLTGSCLLPIDLYCYEVSSKFKSLFIVTVADFLYGCIDFWFYPIYISFVCYIFFVLPFFNFC